MPLKGCIDGVETNAFDMDIITWLETQKKHKKHLVKITLPCCNSPGHMRISKLGVQHFYHASKNKECYWKPESELHLFLKDQICRIAKGAGWNADPEHRFEDHRADVYCTNHIGIKIAFEVELRKGVCKTMFARNKKYLKDGVECYWVMPKNEKHNVFKNLIKPYLDTELLIAKFYKDYDVRPPAYKFLHDKQQSITTEDFVKSVLNGDYQSYLLFRKRSYYKWMDDIIKERCRLNGR
jgi:competence CoiA-like predicted nuclease